MGNYGNYWDSVNCGIWITGYAELFSLTYSGKAPLATGGEGASGEDLASGDFFFASFFLVVAKRKKEVLIVSQFESRK
jgi:hypothetical protein